MLNRLSKVYSFFQKHQVKYLVIGDIAAILHGVPRATFDLDILIEASRQNAENLLKALLAAGIGTAALTDPQQVLENEITVFKDIVRIDVQTITPGIVFENAWQNKITMNYQGQDFFVVAREDLIASKKAAGRNVDLEDVRLLELPQDE
ncbi:hypothetical protein KAR34_05550 [bacterium]|nr:hypothetical protein [bacterium]